MRKGIAEAIPLFPFLVIVIPHATRGRSTCVLATCVLLAFFADFLARTLLRQSLLHPASLTRFQVVGVTLDFFNNVFRLDLALESTEGILY